MLALLFLLPGCEQSPSVPTSAKPSRGELKVVIGPERFTRPIATARCEALPDGRIELRAWGAGPLRIKKIGGTPRLLLARLSSIPLGDKLTDLPPAQVEATAALHGLQLAGAELSMLQILARPFPEQKTTYRCSAMRKEASEPPAGAGPTPRSTMRGATVTLECKGAVVYPWLAPPEHRPLGAFRVQMRCP